MDKRHELEGSPLERFFAEVETCLREAPSVWVGPDLALHEPCFKRARKGASGMRMKGHPG